MKPSGGDGDGETDKRRWFRNVVVAGTDNRERDGAAEAAGLATTEIGRVPPGTWNAPMAPKRHAG